MWRTADGVAHTVALPDWRVAVGAGRDRLETLDSAEKDRLEVALSQSEHQLLVELEGLPVIPGVEDGYVEAAPPPLEIQFSGAVDAVLSDVVTSIAEADLRWRLDYLLAVQDACGDGFWPTGSDRRPSS